MTDASPSGSTAVVAALLLMLGGGAAYWFLAGGGDAMAPKDGPEAPIATSHPAEPLPIASVPVTPRPKDAEPDPDVGAVLTLPDGTTVPNLNGVTVPMKLKWTRNHPYSPVVGKRLANGPDEWEWYEHADGSLSTTVMLHRGDLGRKDATSFVATPKDSVPLDPRLAQQAYEEGLMGTNPPPQPGSETPGK